MASSYTPNLRFTLPVQGELPASWGNTVNTGVTNLVDSAISGTVTKSITGLATYALTVASGATDEARSMFVTLTGSPTAGVAVTCQNVSKLYFVTNSTDKAVIFRPTTGSGITIPVGVRMALYCDGTNVVDGATYLSSLTLGAALPTTSGGTGSTTLASNNVLLGNGTGALQAIAPGTNGNVLTSNGTTWQSTAPGGGSALSAVTAAITSSTLANGNNPIAWNWTQTTASQNGFAIGETTASTGGSGSQVLFKIGTLAASTADPLQVQARGEDTIRVTYTGAVALTGASGGTTGTGANINITSGAGGSTSGASGAIDIRSGTTTSGASGSITIVASAGTGTSATGDINITQANSRATTNGIRITAASAFVTPSAAGSPIVLTAGNGSTLTTGGVGGAVTITSGNGGLAAAGGNLNLTAGNNASSGVGGKVVIRGGISSATQISDSGGVVIEGGVGSAPSIAGGNIALTGGNGSNNTTGGAGGAVDIFGGLGRLAAGVGGAVTIQGGVSEQNLGGAVNIYGGASSTPSTSSSGGSVNIRSGSNGYATSDIAIYSGDGSSGGTTGAITLTTGTLTSGAGRSGDITLQQGASGATPTNGIRILGANARAGSAGVAGGPIALTAGAGSTTTTGALGGDITITAGAGGLALAGGAATLRAGDGGATGAGGAVAITAGNGSSALGGDITLTTGTGSTNGAVNFVNTNVANGAVATTLTSVGPTGAATTVQGWLKIKVGGTVRYIPFW